MDSNQLPAGSRIKLETFDQAPAQRNNRAQQSSIFNNEQFDQPQAQRKSYQAKTDIFSTQHQVVQAPGTRNHQYSQIFSNDMPAPPRTAQNDYMTRSAVFPPSTDNIPEKKPQKGKNSENRLKDHGKDFLFGKSDFNDYKDLKRVQSAAVFQPKLEYDPGDQKRQQLYETEMSRDHLPITKHAQKKQAEITKPVGYDPENKRHADLTSHIFGGNAHQKQSKIGQNGNEGFDTQKSRDQQSAVMKRRATMQFESTTKQKEQDDKKKKDQNISEVFGTKEDRTVNKQKDRLLASNLDWTKVDSVKNLKDYAPGDAQANNQEEALQSNASQKKFSTLKSSMDTHNFQANEKIPIHEKLSVKNLKFKKDVIQSENNKISKQVSKLSKQSQIKAPKQMDKESVI